MTEKNEQRNPYVEQELQDNRARATFGKILSKIFVGLTVLCLAIGQVIPAAVFGVLAAVAGRSQEKSEQKIKERVSNSFIQDLVVEVFRHTEYEPFGHIPDQRIGEAGMVFPFSGYNTVEGSDYIQGTYHDVEVELSDVELLNVECHQDEETGTESETRKQMFKGQWLVCDLERELPGDVRISADTRGLHRQRRRSRTIEMENEEFNRRFLVTADDPQNAFYVLTPHRMEYILSAADKCGGNLYMAFLRNGRVHIAVETGRDFFELGSSRVDSAQLREKFLAEMHWFTDMIDELKIEEAR